MQITNCPRCNMYLAPGAQVCPNCQLNLVHAFQQQQMPHHHIPGAVTETKQEKNYRKLVIVIALVLLADLVVYRFPDLLEDWFGLSLYSVMKPLRFLLTLGWYGIPLAIALVLPKTNKVRTLLIIFASIYAVWQIGHYVYMQWFYTYDDYEYYNF